jgi:hypothetical protein
MKHSLLIFLLFLFVFTGCKKEIELQKSVFIHDETFPDLPQYSEWGYNTFGAYYDREAFISNDMDVPVKVIVTNDTTLFVFQGEKGSVDMSMKFSIANYSPTNYADLILLNDSIINLDTTICKITVIIDGISYNANILNGNLEFSRAQKLFVDTKQIEVILSGRFEFQAIVNNLPITISEGRFDVGVGQNNFFKY